MHASQSSRFKSVMGKRAGEPPALLIQIDNLPNSLMAALAKFSMASSLVTSVSTAIA